MGDGERASDAAPLLSLSPTTQPPDKAPPLPVTMTTAEYGGSSHALLAPPPFAASPFPVSPVKLCNAYTDFP